MQATRTSRAQHCRRPRVTWVLARAPDGIRADEVAETLGKSTSTATTCSRHCATRASPSATPAACTSSRAFRDTAAEESDRNDLSGVVDDLLARTHKRAYLAVLRPTGCASCSRGLQGMPSSRAEPGDRRQRARAGARQGRPRGRAWAAARALSRRRPEGVHAEHDHRPRRAARRARERPPQRPGHRGRGVRAGVLLHGGAGARPPPPLPRRDRISMSARAFELERGALAAPCATSPAGASSHMRKATRFLTDSALRT